MFSLDLKINNRENSTTEKGEAQGNPSGQDLLVEGQGGKEREKSCIFFISKHSKQTQDLSLRPPT